MSTPKKDNGDASRRRPKGPKPVSYKASPQGEADYDALASSAASMDLCSHFSIS